MGNQLLLRNRGDNAINANSLKVIKKNVLKYEDINFHLTRQYISTSIYLIYKTSMRLPDKGKGHSVWCMLIPSGNMSHSLINHHMELQRGNPTETLL